MILDDLTAFSREERISYGAGVVISKEEAEGRGRGSNWIRFAVFSNLNFLR